MWAAYSYDQTMQKDYNIPTLRFRKQCNLMTGGSPNYLQPDRAEPLPGVAAFLGTSYYTATTDQPRHAGPSVPAVQRQPDAAGPQRFAHPLRLAADQLQRPHARRPHLLANYTLSKQIETWGFNDPYNNVYEQGPVLPGSSARVEGHPGLDAAFRPRQEVRHQRRPLHQRSDLRLELERYVHGSAQGLPERSSRTPSRSRTR